MVLRKNIWLLFITLTIILKGNILSAQGSLELNQPSYLLPLANDSLKYAWELYNQSKKWQDIGYPSVCFHLSGEAEKIFNHHHNLTCRSQQELEIILRTLEISFMRNRQLVDKDEEHNLSLYGTFNWVRVGVNLVRAISILEYPLEQSDSVLNFYRNRIRKCKLHYFAGYSLYKTRKGDFTEALELCKTAQTLIEEEDSLIKNELYFQERLLGFLMHPLPKKAEKAVDILRELTPSDFTKDKILQEQTLPLFYLCCLLVADRYEQKHNFKQAVQTYRLMLAELQQNLNPDFEYLLAEERGELGLLLQLYLDKVQGFVLRHLKYSPVNELLFNHTLLKEKLLAVTSSPVFSKIKAYKDLSVLNLQKSIDSIYTSSEYYLLPQQPLYFQKLKAMVNLMKLKRRQVTIVRNLYPNKSGTSIPNKWEDVKELLKPDEAIIKIVDLPINFFNRQYVALILTSTSSYPQIALLPQKQELLRISFKQKNAQRIWKPIAHHLKGHKTLYLCIEGDLADLQWGNMVYKKQALLNKYNLHYLLRIDDLTRLQHQPNCRISVKHNWYGFGGALFSLPPSWKTQRGQGLQYLPGSREELCNIDSLLPSEWTSHLFLGKEANKENFLFLSQKLSSHSIIHIATHGFSLQYNQDIPDGRIVDFQDYKFTGASAYKDPMLRNGFLLSGANRYWNKPIPYNAINSGIVTAHDISQMNLYGTDLVVLSACRSGSGDTKDGEGLFGLIRAFKAAGAKAVLANVNNIPDKDTVLFITTFYRHWIGGENLFKAFCKAQRELMKTKPENSYLWSGFILFE